MTNFFKRIQSKFERVISNTNPLFWPLLSFGFTFLFIFFGMFSEYIPENILTILLFLILMGGAIATPMLGLLLNVINYPVNEKYLIRIILLYIAVMLLFANIYFLFVIFFDPNVPFEGIHHAWIWLGGVQGRRLYLSNVLLSFLDCIHFSCMTIATVGYGDMRPVKWYAKLTADIEVLLGLGIVVIGFGRYFSKAVANNDGAAT